MAIAEFTVGGLSEVGGRRGVSKRDDSCQKRRNGSEFLGHEVCSLSIRNAELTRTLDMRSLELGIVSLILRTENEEVATCGSGSQDSKLKEWYLFQQATTDDLCPGPLTIFSKESES